MPYRGCGEAGRCGERIERCQWQKKRDERVAAVKILSGRRKAASKFWAPQQGHPALRVRDMGAVQCRAGRRGRRPLREHGWGCGACRRRHTWVPPYRGISRGAVKRGVGEIGKAPPVAEEASRFRGSAPIGGHDSGRESVGTTVGNRRPLQGHGWRCGAGRRGRTPLLRGARGAMRIGGGVRGASRAPPVAEEAR